LGRVEYQGDGGPGDVNTQVCHRKSVWYDSIFPVSDDGDQAAVSGDFGGLDGKEDECFYAFQGHGGPYHFAVRDTIYRAGDDGDGTWDWDPDQKYRFCIEKIEAGCYPPCAEFKNGCGTK